MRKVLFLFGQLSDRDVDWLRQNALRKIFASSEVLIEQGRSLTSVYIILSGTVTVSIDEAVVARLGAGELVGEMSFVDARPPSATVVAETAVIALVLSRRSISDHLAVDPLFAARFYRAIALFLSDRLRATEPRRSGYLAHGQEEAGVLDANVLDEISEAGLRFDRLVQATMADGGFAP